MNIEEFNNLQIEKVNVHLSNISKYFKTLRLLVDDYKNKFQTLNDFLSKKEGDKPITQSIRKTFLTISHNLYNDCNNILKKLRYPQHLAIFLKTSIGEYVEKEIAILPSINFYCKDEVCFYDINDVSFLIPQKIKTYIRKEYVENMPKKYWMNHPKNKDRFISTNYFAIFNVEKTVQNLENFTKLLTEIEKNLITNVEILDKTSAN